MEMLGRGENKPQSLSNTGTKDGDPVCVADISYFLLPGAVGTW